MKKIRCAIYISRSSDKELEQGSILWMRNRRPVAYVASQKA